MILPCYTAARRFFGEGMPNYIDGLPQWPGPMLPNGDIDNTGATGKLRINGFSGTLGIYVDGVLVPIDATGFPNTLAFPSFPLTLTCNAMATDPAGNQDTHDWYISQRTDPRRFNTPPGNQYLSVSRSDLGATRRSGMIVIDQVPANVAQLLPDHVGGSFTTAELTLLLRHVHVYVRRRSDGAYQWARLFKD